ncbi:MAG: hypothetical protein KDD62_16250, partial [Bdellovibrionales bacterium]|nr:hypothetical protein [Bdellovibrionales bacterium]
KALPSFEAPVLRGDTTQYRTTVGSEQEVKPSIGERLWKTFSLDKHLKNWGTKAIDWVADKSPAWLKSIGNTVLDYGSKVWNFFQ